MSEPLPSARGPESEEPENETDSSRAAKAAAILGAVFAIAALCLFGGRAALSVTMGAIIAVANLLTMRAIIRALIRAPLDADAVPTQEPPKTETPDEAGPDPATEGQKPSASAEHREAGRRGGVAWGLFAVFKIFILFGGIWILLTRDLVDPIPLVVGYGVLPLGIAASSLWSSLGPRRR
jgi:hypothetical protein